MTVSLLGGCGFRPMYASDSSGSTVLDDFAAIDVDVIADRSGQELRNELLDLLTPRGRPAAPRYRLEVELRENISKFAVLRTGVPTRANLTVLASYELTDLTAGTVALSRSTQAVGSYNLIDSDYATLVAENFARSRVVERIAEDIRTRLAAYFAGGGPADPRLSEPRRTAEAGG